MPQWIVTLFGETLAPIVWVVVVAALVCLLAVVLIVLARKAFGRGMPSAFKSRVPRLAVMDVARIDEKRRLVLVRRDEVEHLLLIGGQADLLIEPGILRVPAGNGGRVEPRAETLFPAPSPVPRPVASTTPGAGMGRQDPSAAREPMREPDRTTRGIEPRTATPIGTPAPAVLPDAARDGASMRPQTPSVDRRRDAPASGPDGRGLAGDGAIDVSPRDRATPAAAAARTATSSMLRPSPAAGPAPAPAPATAPATAPEPEPAARLGLTPAPNRDIPPPSGSAGDRDGPSWPAAPIDREVPPRDAAPSVRPSNGTTQLTPAEPRGAPVPERQAPIVRVDRPQPPLAATAAVRREEPEAAASPENQRPPSPLAMQTPEMELSRANLRAAINSSPSPRMTSVMDATAPAVLVDGPDNRDAAVDPASEARIEQERTRPPLSVKSFATAIQNRKAPPVMPPPATAPAEPGAPAPVATGPQRSPEAVAPALSRGASNTVMPAPAPSAGRSDEPAAGRSGGVVLERPEDEPKASPGTPRAQDTSLEDFLSAELDMSFEADNADGADTGEGETRDQPQVPSVEPDRPVRRPDFSAADETADPPSRTSSDWSTRSAQPVEAPHAEKRPRSDPAAEPSAAPADPSPTIRPAPAQRQAERARALERAAAARAANQERPAPRVPLSPPAPSIDPDDPHPVSATRTGVAGEAPPVSAERGPPREAKAPVVDAPARPASTPVDRAANRPGKSPASPDAPGAPPRQLTLEEEMEQLLGSFDFNESDRRGQR